MKFKSLKNINKLFAFIFTFLFCIASVNAASDRIEIVSTTGGIVNLGENGGRITKTIVSSDTEKGELTVEVKVSNAALTDIFFIIDNSTEIESLGTLKSTIINATKTLTGNLHDNLNNIKTGLLVVHPYGTTTTSAINGGLLSELSDDKNDTIDALDNLNSTSTEDGQDFIEVLNKANDSFSINSENKIIVLIISGIDSTNIETYKEELENIGDDTQIITIVVDNEEAYIENMFGTEETPTTGILYNIDETDVSDTLSTNVNSDILNLLPKNKYNSVLEDIFPESIYENFSIEYVGSPSQGVAGDLNDVEKKFSWSIGNLTNNSIATLRYKLTLNDVIPSNIQDILLNINENITFEYTDDIPSNYNNTYQCSPIIKILITNPKTGLYDYFIPSTIFFSISVLIISIIKRRELFLQI